MPHDSGSAVDDENQFGLLMRRLEELKTGQQRLDAQMKRLQELIETINESVQAGSG